MKESLSRPTPERRDYAPYVKKEKECFDGFSPSLTERGKKIVRVLILLSSLTALSMPAVGSATSVEAKREQPAARDLARDMGRSAVESFRATEIADIIYGEFKSRDFGKTHEERKKNIEQLVNSRVHLFLQATLQEKSDLTPKEMAMIWKKIGINLADQYLKEYPPGMSNKPIQLEQNFKALKDVIRNFK